MESTSDTENSEGQLGSSKVKWDQILTDRRMEVKLGGWVVLRCRNIEGQFKAENVEGQLRIIQGQMGQILTDGRMKPTVESSSDAENVEDQ